MILFTKLHGCGNAYLLLDGSQPLPENLPELARKMSDVRTGIGSDGIILLFPSERADCKIRIFNADGSEAGMCGNGLRCVGRYLWEKGQCRKKLLSVETSSGIYQVALLEKDIRADLGAPVFRPALIPAFFPGETVIRAPLRLLGMEWKVTCLSMGNPHTVVFTDNLRHLDIRRFGPVLEKHPVFPSGTNVEFVRPISPQVLETRVWERGSGETAACGSGACAAAVAAVLAGFCPRGEEISVRMPGGTLLVFWGPSGNVLLTGPAEIICSGTFSA